MIKSWGDHCSSDDEEDHSERVDGIGEIEDDKILSIVDDGVARTSDDARLYENYDNDRNRIDSSASIGGQSNISAPPHGDEIQTESQYNFPVEPPFTAFVGNLSFHIIDAQTFGENMLEIVRDKLGLEITILEAKIIKERFTDRPRGFGYIEVESLHILQQLMELNEIGAFLDGRRLKFDTANQADTNPAGSKLNNRRSGGVERRSNNRGNTFGDVNGSNFRGGTFHNHAVPNDGGKTGESDNVLTSQGLPSSGDQVRRPKLILQPRSIPLEEKKPLPVPKDHASTTEVKSKMPTPRTKPEDGQQDANTFDEARSDSKAKSLPSRNTHNRNGRGDTTHKESTRQGREDGGNSKVENDRSKGSDIRTGRGPGPHDEQRRAYSGRGRNDGNTSFHERQNANSKTNWRGTTGRSITATVGRNGTGEGIGLTISAGRGFASARGGNASFPGRAKGPTGRKSIAAPEAVVSTFRSKGQPKTASDDGTINKVFNEPVEQLLSKTVEVQKNSFAALGYDSDSD